MQNTKKRLENSRLIESWLQDTSFYAPSILASETKIKNAAEIKVLQLFKEAARRVPAYNDFLRKNKIKADTIKTIVDFQAIPPTTKENYIAAYPTAGRCWDGTLDRMHMISASSGTTGQPHFWPRDLATEIDGAYFHEFIFKELCQVDEKKTLLINGFAMGNWIAGTFTLACSNWVALKGYPLTCVTPGYQLESVVEIVQKLATEFEQIIITGHTPFLKEVMEQIAETKIQPQNTNLVLLGTGQSVTESWRDYMIGLNLPSSGTVINMYGSADAALMGVETPFTIQMRRYFDQNSAQNRKVFGDKRLPSLYCFDPRITFFEAIENELHITKRTGCPLIRYNIHDNGGIYQHSDLQKLVPEISNFENSSHNKLPLVYLFGRDKFMVKVYGANIYAEHIQSALNHHKLQSILSGRYLIETEMNKNHDPVMICRIELKKNVIANPELGQLIQEIFVEVVQKLNTEYRFVLHEMGEKAKPIIKLHEHHDKEFFPESSLKKNA